MSDLLLSKLSAVRRKRNAVCATGALLRIIGWSVLLFSLSMLIDWWFDLPIWARAGLLAINLAGSIWTILQNLIAPLIWGPDNDEIALLVESEEPSLGYRLISSVQLMNPSNAQTVPEGTSTTLVSALISQTEDIARSIDFGKVIKIDGLAKLAGGVTLFTVICASAFAMGLPASTDLLKRALLMPGISVPRKTQVEAVTGNTVVARGDAVTIVAGARGIIPSYGTLRLEYSSGVTQQFGMNPIAEKQGDFARTIDNVQESFTYTVQLNDGRSQKFDVRAEPRPAVSGVECVQIYPAYTGLGSVKRGTGDLSLLAGSRLAVNVTASKPVKLTTDADRNGNRLRLLGNDQDFALIANVNDTRQLMVKDGIDRSISLPAGTTGFTLHLVDEFGLKSKDTAVYRIDLIPDKAPTVQVTSPEKKEELVTKRAMLIIGFDASDDFGLAKAAIKYKINSGEEKSISLETGGVPKTLRGFFQWDLSKVSGNIEEGQTVEWWVEVQDANTATGPGLGLSDHYMARVVSESEKRAELMNRLNESIGQINDVSESQKDINAKLGQMITQKEGQP